MEYFDFLSSSPSFSIFQKKTNKIKFGGVLFLIYIIIMLFICLIYILDYIINEKYEIESSVFVSFRDQLTTDERNLNKIPEININFLIKIESFGFNKSSDNLVLKKKENILNMMKIIGLLLILQRNYLN